MESCSICTSLHSVDIKGHYNLIAYCEIFNQIYVKRRKLIKNDPYLMFMIRDLHYNRGKTLENH